MVIIVFKQVKSERKGGKGNPWLTPEERAEKNKNSEE